MNTNILFIIFPGFGSTLKHFKLNDVNGKFDNNNDFVNKLKELGEIYFVQQNWNNITYYNKYEKKEHYLYDNDIDFTLNDLNMQNLCNKIYDDVKTFNGKYILIGHSIGSMPLYYFSQKYSFRCMANFLIDGTIWGPFYINKKMHDKMIKICEKITNQTIQKLIENVKKYNIQSIKLLNDIIGACLEKQLPMNVKKIKVITYSFRNLQIDEDPSGRKHSKEEIKIILDAEQYFYKNNVDKYKTIYFINKTHFPHWQKESRKIILDMIKCISK